jgi:2-amino-4-hydroxy-6-hydroxymethyldihydropteridine diphosphokinase
MLEMSMGYTAFIGIGSNLASAAGDPRATVQAAIRALGAVGSVEAQSSLYRTAPVGFREQPYFVNAAVCLRTARRPDSLLHDLLEIERSFGRDRRKSVPKGPRTIDLDLLLVFADEGEAVLCESPTLTLPHPEMASRRFVLQPIVEIGPEVLHPVLRKTMRQLLEELSAKAGDPEEVTPL